MTLYKLAKRICCKRQTDWSDCQSVHDSFGMIWQLSHHMGAGFGVIVIK